MSNYIKDLYEKEGATGDSGVELNFVTLTDLKLAMEAEIALYHCHPVHYAFSLQHQLALLISRVTTARCGAIFTTLEPDGSVRWPGLTWGDVGFIRHVDSRVESTIFLRHLNNKQKQNSIDRGIPEYRNSMRARLLSPKRLTSLVYSIPHRLLSQAISSGVLFGIETMEDAFSVPLIRVDPRFASLPVFAIPDNLAKPVTATEACIYLRNMSTSMGYPVSMGYRGIRRQAATDFARRIGVETTRRIMGHRADSSTLEKSYLFAEQDLDLTAVSLEEDAADSGHSAMLRQSLVTPHLIPLTKTQHAQARQEITLLAARIMAQTPSTSRCFEPALASFHGNRGNWR
ncbi:hypothetical protein LTR10_011300 [Elasticomyces elasticus]|nr:hypothetical protein LTR10_011300 [Elasticomyces elasticus]KAK4966285.1 hypothetical protein LTR42_011446 [Elasticomyces elasticus]